MNAQQQDRLADLRAQHRAFVRQQEYNLPHNRRPQATTMRTVHIRMTRRWWNRTLRRWERDA